jgi:histidine triad (HIT) family protein
VSDTIFGKIARKEIPADIVYEDELCLAFKDIDPQAPVHVLLIPKAPVARLADATQADATLLGHLLLRVPEIARSQGIGDAFRVVVNNGEDAGQEVFHLHLHILGGRPLSWPPG